MLHKKIKQFVPGIFHDSLFRLYLKTRTSYWSHKEKINLQKFDKKDIFEETAEEVEILSHIQNETLVTKKTICATKVAKLHNCKILHERGYVLQDNRFYYESSVEFNKYPKIQRIGVCQKTTNTITIPKAIIICMPPEVKHNYYHFIQEFMSKVYLTRSIKDAKIICNKFEQQFQYEILEKAGITRDQLVYSKDGQEIVVEEAYIPVLLDNEVGGPTAYYDWLHQHLHTNTKGKLNAPTHIYMSRKDTKVRKIRNERQLLDLLPYQFTQITNTGVALSEQIARVSNAQTILGGEGTNLMNAMFAPKECHIVQCNSPIYKDVAVIRAIHRAGRKNISIVMGNIKLNCISYGPPQTWDYYVERSKLLPLLGK